MIGGSKGHPGGKMIRAEAVPAVKTMTNSKMPVNTSFFIFLPPLLFLLQMNRNSLFLFMRQYIFRRIN